MDLKQPESAYSRSHMQEENIDVSLFHTTLKVIVQINTQSPNTDLFLCHKVTLKSTQKIKESFQS